MSLYSIRCLKAIEQFVGSRELLAEKLGCSKSAINNWVHKEKISKGAVLDLVRLSNRKFRAEELLGQLDDDDDSE
jgi:hypothetical protein